MLKTTVIVVCGIVGVNTLRPQKRLTLRISTSKDRQRDKNLGMTMMRNEKHTLVLFVGKMFFGMEMIFLLSYLVLKLFKDMVRKRSRLIIGKKYIKTNVIENGRKFVYICRCPSSSETKKNE